MGGRQGAERPVAEGCPARRGVPAEIVQGAHRGLLGPEGEAAAEEPLGSAGGRHVDVVGMGREVYVEANVGARAGGVGGGGRGRRRGPPAGGGGGGGGVRPPGRPGWSIRRGGR